MLDKAMSEPVLPSVYALVLCGMVYRDSRSGNWTMVGTFDTIHAAQYPAQHAPIAVYVALTEVHGQSSFRIRFVRADDDEGAIAEIGGRLSAPDPMAVVELGANFPGVVFPEEGEYRVQLVVSDVILIERRITAKLAEQI